MPSCGHSLSHQDFVYCLTMSMAQALPELKCNQVRLRLNVEWHYNRNISQGKTLFYFAAVMNLGTTLTFQPFSYLQEV